MNAFIEKIIQRVCFNFHRTNLLYKRRTKNNSHGIGFPSFIKKTRLQKKTNVFFFSNINKILENIHDVYVCVKFSCAIIEGYTTIVTNNIENNYWFILWIFNEINYSKDNFQSTYVDRNKLLYN